MTVLFYLKKNRRDTEGLCPLMGKITLKGDENSIAAFSCKMKVDPKIWNSSFQRCAGRSRIAIKINKEIESILLSIHKRFDELQDSNNLITVHDIKNCFQGTVDAQVKLLDFFQKFNDEYALRVGVDRAEVTYYNYCNTYRILSEFVELKYKISDVVVKTLDLYFIRAFDKYLRECKKHQPSTILGHISRLTNVIYTAVDKGIIPMNPFEDFEPERPQDKLMYLNEFEFSKLIKTSFEKPCHNFVRDMFTFASFSGLSYCDMRKLTKSELIKDDDGNVWIKTVRQKTKTLIHIMLIDAAVKIIDKYENTTEDGKVFPMTTNASMNKHLKKMAKICGIRRNLAFHCARHRKSFNCVYSSVLQS